MSHLEKKVQNIWLITFGDLLTLLLCFFIAVITLSGAGVKSFQDAMEKTASENNDLVRARYSPSRETETGTVVANLRQEAKPALVEVQAEGRTILEMTFSEPQLSAGVEPAAEALNRVLTPWTRKDSLKASTADIESCVPLETAAEEAAWSISSARALAVRRQLIDLGFPDSRLRLRSIGSECRRLGAGIKKPGPEVSLRVTAVFTRLR